VRPTVMGAPGGIVVVPGRRKSETNPV